MQAEKIFLLITIILLFGSCSQKVKVAANKLLHPIVTMMQESNLSLRFRHAYMLFPGLYDLSHLAHNARS